MSMLLSAGYTILAAAPPAVPNPPGDAAQFTLAGETFFASAILFGLLSFLRKSLWANALRWIILALGIGALVVTSPILLAIGNGFLSFCVKILGLARVNPDQAVFFGQTLFTAIIVIVFGVALYRYSKDNNPGHFWWLLAASVLFFTASFARNFAVSYTTGFGHTLGKGVLILFHALGITT